MTETPTIITRARTILRDLRAAATPGEWHAEQGGALVRAVTDAKPVATMLSEYADATLISVLAGNPKFLDATDRMLRSAQRYPGLQWIDGDAYLFREHAECIASAIVSGWEAVQR